MGQPKKIPARPVPWQDFELVPLSRKVALSRPVGNANLMHTLPFLLQIESLEHCDFLSLRDMLIRTHLQDLKERTSDTLYENYRCLKLSSCCKNASHVSNFLAFIVNFWPKTLFK